MKAIGKRRIETDRPGSDACTGAVSPGFRVLDEHGRFRDLSAYPDVVGCVIHVHRVPTVEAEHTAWKMTAKFECEIERHASGDVRWPLVVVQPSRKVDAFNVKGARAAPARHRGVEREMALYGSSGARRLISVPICETGPFNVVSNDASTAMFERPRITPDHS